MAKKDKRLTRSKQDRMLAGVCGGLAEYLDTDPTLVRGLTVLVTIFTGFLPMTIAYLVLAIITPEN